MNKKKLRKIETVIFILAVIIIILAEVLPNFIYNQHKEDCDDSEKFSPQSIITKVGYCKNIPVFKTYTNESGICLENEVLRPVTCDCAKNTTTPCLGYCFKCEDA